MNDFDKGDFMWKDENEGANDGPPQIRLPTESDLKDCRELMLKAKKLAHEILGDAAIASGPGFILEVYDRILTHTQIRHLKDD